MWSDNQFVNDVLWWKRIERMTLRLTVGLSTYSGYIFSQSNNFTIESGTNAKYS
jgi:hypothetical protein